MKFTEVLSRFKARRNGSGWMAKCPAHDDRQASLSMTEGADGRTLVKCHAGCTVDAIVSAAGLTSRDLFLGDGKPEIVDEYPYEDEKGNELYQVVRLEPKSFRQRRQVPPNSGRYTWSVGNVRRVLFQLPELKDQKDVYIVEGEKDCYRLRQRGLSATTNAGGAGKWRTEYVTQLKQAGAERIYVIPDNDDPGREHARQIAKSCHAAGLIVRIVELPDVPPKGDVSDYFDARRADGRRRMKEDLVALAESAPIYTGEGSQVVEGSGPVIVCLADVKAEAIDWIWPQRLARGKKTLIAGDPGKGKSTLVNDIASRITTGAEWPDGGRAPLGNVLLLVAEDGLADTIRPSIDRSGGDARRVFVLESIREGNDRRLVNLARDISAITSAIEQVKPVIVDIDPITAYLGKTDSYKDAEVRALLAPLLATIENHRCALLTVAHLSKDQQRAALHRPGGSIAFVAAARLVFAVAADPNDDERRILAPLKANICAPAPSLAFRLPDGRVTWESGPVNLDAEALLRGGPSREEREEHTDGESFLREFLGDGPQLSTEILKAAESNGISRRTLFRLKSKLGVRATRIGGVAAAGKWTWSLSVPPECPTVPAPEAGTDSTLSTLRPISVPFHSKSANSLAQGEDHDASRI